MTTEVCENTVFRFNAGVAVAESKGIEPKDGIEAMDSKHMLRTVDSAVFLLGSKQDMIHTCHRSSIEGDTWIIAAFDGHGNDVDNVNPLTGKREPHNLTLQLLQELKTSGELDEILLQDIYGKEDPALIIQHKVADLCAKYDREVVGGSTMSMAQIHHDYASKKITVQLLMVGDSPIVVYRNGEKVLEPTIHDYTNTAEINRLSSIHRRVEITPSASFEILDEDSICAAPSKYVKINGRQLSVTQALGHMDYRNPYTCYNREVKCREGIYAVSPDKFTLEFNETDEINIKIFSDGVGDIINAKLEQDAALLQRGTATELATFAKERWEKPWDAVNRQEYNAAVDKSTITRQRQLFGNTADDVCCVSWIQKERY